MYLLDSSVLTQQFLVFNLGRAARDGLSPLHWTNPHGLYLLSEVSVLPTLHDLLWKEILHTPSSTRTAKLAGSSYETNR